MADRPILLHPHEVRGILDGRQSQVRRVLRPQPDTSKVSPPFHPEPRGGGSWVFMARDDFPGYSYATADFKVPYHVGDRLWVREAWRTDADAGDVPPREMYPELYPIWFEADRDNCDRHGKLRPSIHMPRWASRLTLTVTDVRVQRLQEISFVDCRAEGASPTWSEVVSSCDEPGCDGLHRGEKWHFKHLWDSINAKRPGCAWEDDPWVVVVGFTAERRNIDA